MKAFKHLAVLVSVALGLAVGTPSAASAAPIPFGSDLATVPFSGMSTNFTVVLRFGGSGSAPAGYVAPSDGLISGWRVRAAGAGSSTLRFHVVRGNTSIYKGPAVDVGTADGVSATFPVSVLVQQGDKIGLTNDSGLASRQVVSNPAGASYTTWTPPLGANDTRAPSSPAVPLSLAVQADLDAAASVCGGAQATIAGTAGPDVILGTAGNDVIVALGGNDIVRGLGGDDIICGGDGNDKLKGGAGRDQLFGDAGVDKLRGGAERDTCTGGPQRDSAKKCERVRSL